MGYIHIDNLYKDQTILLFKECFALEKVHGTRACVTFRASSPQLTFFSGRANHEAFVRLFDHDALRALIAELGHSEVTIHGEAYGGSLQGMADTYGPDLRFIGFDVKIGDCWLSVLDMTQVLDSIGIECVPYSVVSTDLADLDRERDRPSDVAVRRLRLNGIDRRREGIILRPLIEVTLNNGRRVIAKHKIEAFSERATPQKVVDAAKLVVLAEARAIAQEWVTPTRLAHVIDQILGSGEIEGPLGVTATARVIRAMIEDVYREAYGEIVESKDAATAIGRRTAKLFKAWRYAQETQP